MKLVIAEKPSVAAVYANILLARNRHDGYYTGNGYIVTWCVGHLVSLAMPQAYDEKYKKWDLANLPFIPEKWKYAIKQDTAKQYNIVKNLLLSDDISEVICGTDAGREGELIFRHVYNVSGCKKPIKRLWVSSMEDTAIRQGFENLKFGDDYINLYYAALARQRIDYLAGMNFSPLITLLYGGDGVIFSVGRVQTTTLRMIADRDISIENFAKEKYYVVHIKVDGLDAVSEHISDKSVAEKMQKDCDKASAIVKTVEKKMKKVSTPLLYDLTTLQRDANRWYGFTSDKTLKITQKLYEDKLVTYPRTDSSYLTEDMVEKVNEVAEKTKVVFGLSTDIVLNKQLFNNKKVSDHHAIIPTLTSVKLDDLSSDEQKIYSLISMRLICALNVPYVYESTNVVIGCKEYDFKTSANVVKDRGFRAIEDDFKKKYKANTEKNENEVPNIDITLTEGMNIDSVDSVISEEYTKPPQHFTEDTLLLAMERAGNKDMVKDVERKGIGTPATRAEIIETLVKREYVIRDKKKILITEKGKYLISVVPERMKSVELTVDMENDLVEISNGNMPYQAFMDKFITYVSDMIAEYSGKDIIEKKTFVDGAIGKCPKCGEPIKDTKISYCCSNKECKVILFKENRYLESLGKNLTKKIASDFFNKGYSNIKDLKSKKTGNSFDAKVICKFNDEGQATYSLEFKDGGKKK